jgi:hypothetical protein
MTSSTTRKEKERKRRKKISPGKKVIKSMFVKKVMIEKIVDFALSKWRKISFFEGGFGNIIFVQIFLDHWQNTIYSKVQCFGFYCSFCISTRLFRLIRIRSLIFKHIFEKQRKKSIQ